MLLRPCSRATYSSSSRPVDWPVGGFLMAEGQNGDLGHLLRLDGKVAIVTGAAQRIGREIAQTFASQGARVLVADIQDDLGEHVVQAISTAGGTASFVHADVGRAEEVRSMIGSAVGRFGRLDILVNN